MVIGRRGEVETIAEPLATFDARAIAATGATSISELLATIRGVTQSADGQDPIFLLNAQRVSGYQEIGSLPPEAIEKVEVLPEPVALQFGYPPTRRIVNFITKRRFRQLAVKPALGAATRDGARTGSAHVDLTRLHDDGRLTLSVDAKHTDALRQSSRHVFPDPDVPFDAVGNVTGLGPNAEIDPALSAVAGQRVTIAPVPNAAPTLAGFAAGANMPRLFDLSPVHDLAAANDTLHAEMVLANRIGRSVAGSLTLTADQAHERSIYGPSSATLAVPAGNLFSPFRRDVLLQRYLTEGPLLGARSDTTTLHAGALLRGAWRGWQWDWTGTLDAQRKAGVADAFTDVTAANAAIAAGANPFAPLAPVLVDDVRANRLVLVTHGAATKMVASNSTFRLPAGRVALTTTFEAERTGSTGITRGPAPYDAAFARTRIEGGVTLDVPIASRKQDVLAWTGELSANASANLRHVDGFETLADTTVGLTWAPVAPVQFLLQFQAFAAAPKLDQLAIPQAIALQASVFNFGTGQSDIRHLVDGRQPRSSRRAQPRPLARRDREAVCRQGNAHRGDVPGQDDPQRCPDDLCHHACDDHRPARLVRPRCCRCPGKRRLSPHQCVQRAPAAAQSDAQRLWQAWAAEAAFGSGGQATRPADLVWWPGPDAALRRPRPAGGPAARRSTYSTERR